MMIETSTDYWPKADDFVKWQVYLTNRPASVLILQKHLSGHQSTLLLRYRSGYRDHMSFLVDTALVETYLWGPPENFAYLSDLLCCQVEDVCEESCFRHEKA